MKLHVLVVRDIMANVYGQPFFVAHVGSAIRSFADQINNPKRDDVISQHPEHFELFNLGTYEDDTATFELKPLPEQIAAGANLIMSRN